MYEHKTLVPIFCLHRSGSSFLANILQRLGMSLGPFALLGSHPSNQHGHFEAIPILELAREVQTASFGFPDIVPDSADLLQQFIAHDGQWPAGSLPSDSALERGTRLLSQLLESGAVSGIKDPRLPLIWPFWQKVMAGFPGLRVVPIFLIRSPHEVAMSACMRDFCRYRDALDVTAVHFSRMLTIMESWEGAYAVVRFDPRTMADDVRRAATLCGLDWQEDVLKETYDSACRHHEPAVVSHRAQDLFGRMCGTGIAATLAENETQLQQDAVRREDAMVAQIAMLRQENAPLHQDIVRLEQDIIRLDRELVLRKQKLVEANSNYAEAIARVRQLETYPPIRLGLQIRRKVHDLLGPHSSIRAALTKVSSAAKSLAPTRSRMRTVASSVGVYCRRIGRVSEKAWHTLRSEGFLSFCTKSRRKLKYLFHRHHPSPSVPHSVTVSVIIPVYDRTDVLRQSIESILAQDFQDFELLLACDGSPPETMQVVQEYADHPKVRIFSWAENSGGPVKGRNLMIAQARGKYIAFQDSDDLAEPHRLRLCVKALDKGTSDVVYGSFRTLTAWDQDWRSHKLRNGQVVASPSCDIAMLRKQCVPIQSTIMARASALRLVGGLKPEMRYREDHELWVRMADRGYRFQSLPAVLTSLRLHPANLELRHYQDSARWHQKLLEVYPQRGPLLPRVAFLLAGIGVSGGVAVVLQYAHRLRALGHDVTVITMDDDPRCDWFPYHTFPVVPFSQARGEMFDVLVATFWTTAAVVDAIPAARKLYFIQLDESRFYPGDVATQQAVFKTYRMELEMVTVAKWLQRWLKENFDRDALYLPNGLDPLIFHPAEPLAPKGSRPRMLLEGAIDLVHKGMKTAFEVVQDLDCEVWCISGSGKPAPGWHCDRFFEKVPHFEMKHIYSSCDIFLKMSEAEAFFLPPLEMMACGRGACVLGEVTGIDEYVEDGVNALVVKRGDVEGARRAIQRLIDDPQLRQRLVENGLRTARRLNWDALTKRFQEILCSPLSTRPEETTTDSEQTKAATLRRRRSEVVCIGR